MTNASVEAVLLFVEDGAQRPQSLIYGLKQERYTTCVCQDGLLGFLSTEIPYGWQREIH